MIENFSQTAVGIRAIEEILDLTIILNPPVFTHPEKDDAVNSELNSKI